ncbi:hypothetical protein BDFB_007802 [Asbolus verrucosus]|uniref:Uncharacterized protein n=1 Tax=Asbolus verrucosus TaxID=1661398 RepID=A0A482W0N3_ASBVE|nr:hypothetical protein BDFB_007802 [Asbolus verrucosus]
MNNKGFKEGEWEFVFTNGDTYTGEYCAHVSGLAWRQGRGVYNTHEGQIYEGIWKDDKLDESENLQITYQNSNKYTGRISKYKYSGSGTYWFKNGGRLTCIFENNKPSGDVIYIDHHDKLWYGNAEDDHVLLHREHVFSYELDGERGKGRPKYPPLEIAEEVVEPEEFDEEIDMKELEKQIFAKSTKTASEIDFEDSDWFKDFQRFTEMYKTVTSKFGSSGAFALNEAEKKWYKAYLKSTKILEGKNSNKLKITRKDPLKVYLNEELKNTCPPTSVFYPAQFGEQEQVEQ